MSLGLVVIPTIIPGLKSIKSLNHSFVSFHSVPLRTSVLAYKGKAFFVQEKEWRFISEYLVNLIRERLSLPLFGDALLSSALL